MEWSSVQEERPRASTSGGQSVGREGAAVGWAVVVDFLVGILPEKAKREATSLQVRHL
jgi:hypothetical protein